MCFFLIFKLKNIEHGVFRTALTHGINSMLALSKAETLVVCESDIFRMIQLELVNSRNLNKNLKK